MKKKLNELPLKYKDWELCGLYKQILCLFVLNREGRAALVSSFGVFKYLTMYGIIQFIGTSLLYWV